MQKHYKTQFAFITLFISVTLLFFSCNNEELEKVNNDSISTQLQKELHLNQFTDKKFSGNLVVNWQKINTTVKDSTEIFEFEMDQKDTIKLESKFFREQLNYKLIAVKKDNEIHSYLVEIFSNLNYNYPGSLSKLENFAGTLNVFELSGKALGQLVVSNGKAQNPANVVLLEDLQNALNLFDKPNSITTKAPACMEVGTALIITTVYQDVYQITSLQSTGVVLSVNYLYTKEVRTYVTEMAVQGLCGTTVDQIHHLERSASYNRVFLDEQIEYNDLDSCSKEVLEKLMYGQTSKIMDIFNKFNADLSKYNVVFKKEATDDGTPAATKRISPFNYKIQVSSDYTDATKLFKASNMLHEMIHAYFMSIKEDYSNATIPDPAVFNNYPTLFQAYVEKKYPGKTDYAHHIEMANQYVDAIATALKEYNKYADPNGLISEQVYTDLAWGGLKGTPVYETTFKEGTLERLRVENRYACEQTGHTVGYSAGQAQNPVGKPCN